jgi:hypothetical protein
VSSVESFGAEWYREQIRIKNRVKSRDQAEKGHVAGGKVLGYKNVDVLVDGKRSHVRREVDPAQADIVRRIFQLCADGKGLKRIVKSLNDAGVVNPTGQARGTRGVELVTKSRRLWSATGVRDVLHRELYRGVVVYGKKQGMDRDGRPVRVDGPRGELAAARQARAADRVRRPVGSGA